MFKKILAGAIGLIFLIGLVWLDFYLPEATIVTVTNTEVKRQDFRAPEKDQTTGESRISRDFYQVLTIKENGKTRVFKNTDTGWGFPFYFKFDSADVQAQAAAAVNDGKPRRFVSYGWRLDLISAYPNLLKVESADKGDGTPWFRYLGFALYLILWILGFFYVRKKLKQRAQTKALKDREAEIRLANEQGRQAPNNSVDDFINNNKG
ncbi:DUF1523 family protein [Gayadomonas joobiniege]|uniref:DUF1523 family protein n=1 Tax=Gayadomonas joobiniege TaxID=1234606 RepID=UPI00038009AE|nr:DUF1523 family protein [Gayadomonas joobiniege]